MQQKDLPCEWVDSQKRQSQIQTNFKALAYLLIWFLSGASVHFYVHFVLTNVPAVPTPRMMAGYMYDLSYASAFCCLAMVINRFFHRFLEKALLLTILTLLYLWSFINALHIQYFSVFVSHVNLREFFKIQQLGLDFLWSSLFSLPFFLLFVLPWVFGSTGLIILKRPFPVSSYVLIALIGIAANTYANGESGGFSSNPKILSSYNYLYQSLHHIKASEFSVKEDDFDQLNDFFRESSTQEKNVWYPLLEETINEKVNLSYPNIILLIMESMGSHCIDEEVTPNLFHLRKESRYFANYYSPVRNTAAALFTLQNSMLTPLDYIANSYAYTTYKNLPEILREHGFSNYHFDAAEVHESQENFYLKNGNVQSWGGNAMLQEINNRSAPIASDEVLYQFFVKKLPKLKQPYFAALSPMATHGPYVMGENHRPVYPDQVKDAYHYADRQFGSFFTQFKKNSLFENTLLFVTSDTSTGCFYKKNGSQYGQLMAQLRVPFHIYHQSLREPVIESKMGSHIDFAPTLLHYLGISYQSSFLGRSLLKPSDLHRVFYIKTAMRGWIDHNQCVLAQTQDLELSYQCEEGSQEITSGQRKKYLQTLRILDTLEYLNVNNRITPRILNPAGL
ncbi:MAG: LTA synthase family protein [SAR324 cluster bacterium]|nr:LTA synthase family protein [SAR324 cluster bacterium]